LILTYCNARTWLDVERREASKEGKGIATVFGPPNRVVIAAYERGEEAGWLL
jgi:hypothetical protein